MLRIATTYQLETQFGDALPCLLLSTRLLCPGGELIREASCLGNLQQVITFSINILLYI